MNIEDLNSILENGTRGELEDFCAQNDLIISDNKIFHKNLDEVKKQVAFWDKRQLVKKINLNS